MYTRKRSCIRSQVPSVRQLLSLGVDRLPGWKVSRQVAPRAALRQEARKSHSGHPTFPLTGDDHRVWGWESSIREMPTLTGSGYWSMLYLLIALMEPVCDVHSLCPESFFYSPFTFSNILSNSNRPNAKRAACICKRKIYGKLTIFNPFLVEVKRNGTISSLLPLCTLVGITIIVLADDLYSNWTTEALRSTV